MDPYAHLTPKPLEEQVPGAWNFVEPNPNAQTLTLGAAAPRRLTLMPDARARLEQTHIVGRRTEGEYLDEDDWREFEDALADILMPTGVRRSDPSGRPGHSQLVAGGH